MILKLLQYEGFIETQKDMFILSTKGKIANHLNEVHCLVFADLIDNSDDIVANDPSFGKVFLKEKAHLLDVMDKVHAHALFAIATGAVNQG